jgi:hypothetical protein
MLVALVASRNTGSDFADGTAAVCRRQSRAAVDSSRPACPGVLFHSILLSICSHGMGVYEGDREGKVCRQATHHGQSQDVYSKLPYITLLVTSIL